MSRVSELLNQIEQWVSEYNPEEYYKLDMTPGLSGEEIQAYVEEVQSYIEGKPYILPREIVEIYQWHNGIGNGSLFPSPKRSYCDKEFYSLAVGLDMGEDWENVYCPGKHLLVLFSHDGNYYWTVLPETQQEFAPIYCNDEPDFATALPGYPSLTAFLEEQLSELKKE